MRTLSSMIGLLLATSALTGGARGSEPSPQGQVSFGSHRWTVAGGEVVDFLGREAFMGKASLKGVEFDDGVLEVDIAVPLDRTRSYPGITFRGQPDGSRERVYIRPHRSALYRDVLQYVAAFNGVDSWQLHSGPGIIDGIETVGRGSDLVAHNAGRVFRVRADGFVTKLLDHTVVGRNAADLAYLGSAGLLVNPTFSDNRVVAYTLAASPGRKNPAPGPPRPPSR